eukprot:scaffold1130_cov127-Isochrysis_galbana.AAC.9
MSPWYPGGHAPKSQTHRNVLRVDRRAGQVRLTEDNRSICSAYVARRCATGVPSASRASGIGSDETAAGKYDTDVSGDGAAAAIAAGRKRAGAGVMGMASRTVWAPTAIARSRQQLTAPALGLHSCSDCSPCARAAPR